MKNKTITKVIRVDNETKKLMADFYKDMKRDKTPPYAIFQADTGDTIVTLYESGKAMFQGVSADIEAGMWESIGKWERSAKPECGEPDTRTVGF